MVLTILWRYIKDICDLRLTIRLWLALDSAENHLRLAESLHTKLRNSHLSPREGSLRGPLRLSWEEDPFMPTADSLRQTSSLLSPQMVLLDRQRDPEVQRDSLTFCRVRHKF